MIEASATEWSLSIVSDTVLTEDHQGRISVTRGGTLDCAGHTVTPLPGESAGAGISGSDGAVVRNYRVSGFEFGIEAENANGITVENNQVSDSPRLSMITPSGIGIELQYVADSVVRGNRSLNNGSWGFHIVGDRVTVADNTASGNSAGFELYGSMFELQRNTATGNSSGFALRGGSNHSMSHNVATGNQYGGIQTDNVTDSTFEFNTATDNGTGFLLSGSNLTMSHNIATGNQGPGIATNSVRDSTFEFNDSSWNGNGFLDSDGRGNTYTGNTANANDGWGFLRHGTTNHDWYSSNRCVNNGAGGAAMKEQAGVDPVEIRICSESGYFADDDDSVFELDIEWMAEEGITRGCNPPANDQYCPTGNVTRGQMAAFLVRALDLTDQLDDHFIDDDDSIFEADIEKLAAAGITKGCNPSEGNTRFCPDAKVTRGQMAAFLVRAMEYTNDGGGDLFTDDDHSIFEHDIDCLGTAGVTKGCNPAEGNTKYCPDTYVTRGQMAAFLHRALT